MHRLSLALAFGMVSCALQAAVAAGSTQAAAALQKICEDVGYRDQALFWRSQAEKGKGGLVDAGGFDGLVFAVGLKEKFEEWQKELDAMDPFAVDL